MTKKAKIVRELSIDELKTKVEELKINYAKEIVKSKTGARNEKAVNLKNMKKDIARVLTILTEKEYDVLNGKTIPKAKTEKKVVAPKVVVEKKPTVVKAVVKKELKK
jgi:large subunit ribosomal protein L29